MRNGAGSEAIADYCRDKCGVVLGRGLGAHEGKAFRIAHMGHVNAPMIFGTLSVVEMALAALNVPHGRGGAQARWSSWRRPCRPERRRRLLAEATGDGHGRTGSSPAMHRRRRAPTPLPVLVRRGATVHIGSGAQIPRPLRPARQYP